MVVPVLVAAKVGVCPETGLLEASLSVIVMVEVDTPSAATGPVPVIEEFATETAPTLNRTVPSVLLIGVAIERVLSSAVVDLSVQFDAPEASVTEQAP